MNELIIPPSPSWYLSNVMTSSHDGAYMVYGAKHELVILKVDVTSDKPLVIKPSFIAMAHKDKINCVVFSPATGDNKYRLVTSSDDGMVRVWDCESRLLLFSHSGHEEGKKVHCVDWSKADPNLIVSVGETGSIVCWDLGSNTIRKLSGTKISASCIACCPHNKDIIAIGSKAGLIVIQNVKGDGNALFRIRGHETDIVSLAWCPEPYNIFKNDKSEKALLLMSGSKDRLIYFWRAGTDGRFELTLSLPTQALASGFRAKNGAVPNGSAWICVRWPETHTIVTSSLFGEALSFDLRTLNCTEKSQDAQTKKQKMKAFKLIHGNHTKGLFSIAISPMPSRSEELLVWTTSIDKHIVASKLMSAEVLLDITGIGGTVYCMAVNPLDPNRIALGVGDNKVLIWNISNGFCDNMTTFWNKISNKVMAVAWHPSKDSILAFSTGEGRIGVMDVSTNKQPVLLRLHHRRSVYSLIWAPPIIKTLANRLKKWDLALFSVGDGEIVQYDVDSPDKEPEDLGEILSECDLKAKAGKVLSRTDLAWNHDLTLAAIGNDNGIVHIVDGKDFSHRHTYYPHKKIVQCLVWHPSTVTSENEMSPYSSWLASAGDNIQIVDVSTTDFKIVATFTSHTEKVVSLAWSPHFNGRLFSASYDYTCLVWDVVCGNLIACYDGHNNAVLCCLPSPLHPDNVITGSADCSIHVWNIKKHATALTPKNKKQRLSGALKKLAGAQEACPASIDTLQSSSTFLKQSNGQEIGITKPETSLEMRRKARSMFPVVSANLSHARNLDVLWSRLNGQEPADLPPPSDVQYLDFFGDSKAMRKLLALQEKNHRENSQYTSAQHISLWAGDLDKALKEACQKKHLSDWLVSLAPMVSHKMWQDCCVSYAEQLAENGDALKASSYYLSVHKVEEAVEVLISGKLVREAVALAKSRFPSSDPTVTKALIAWAHHSNSIGNLNLTAHCFLSAGNVVEAIETLARSKEPASLSLAAKMASSIDAKDMAVNLAVRSVTTSLSQKNYVKAKEALDTHEFKKDLVLWVETCQLIGEKKPFDEEEGLKWITCQGCEVDSIFKKALEMSKDIIPNYDTLVRYIPSKPARFTSDNVWMFIGGQVALAAAALLNKLTRKSVEHLLNAFNAAYSCIFQSYSNPEIFKQLSLWISPKGPLEEIESIKDADAPLLSSLRAFILCGAVYWVGSLVERVGREEDDSNIDAVYRVVGAAASLVLSKDLLLYFKNNIEIKRLESSITAAKLNIPLTTVKYCTDIEAELCNGEADEKMKSVVNGSSEGEAGSPVRQPSPLPDEKAKLEQLKSSNKKFEEERCFSPNPVVIYCNIDNTLQTLLAKRVTKVGTETRANVTDLWNIASTD